MSEVAATPPAEPSQAEGLPEQLPKEAWVACLTDPEHQRWLRQALSSFPPGVLARFYRSLFRPQEKEGYLLVKTPGLKQVTDERVLENLDRLRERRPKVLVALAEAWLDYYQAPLLALGRGEPVQEGVNLEALEVGCWLWESDEFSSQPTWAMVRNLLKLPSLQVPENPKTNASALEAIKLEVEELHRRLNKLEREKSRLQGEQAELELKHNALRMEKDALTAQLRQEQQAYKQSEVRAAEAKARTTQLQQELNERLKDLERLRSDLYDRDQEILRLQRINRNEADRLQQANALAERLRGELKELHERTRRLERQGAYRVPLPHQLLEQALVIDYPNLSTTPVERLIGLLELYRALLEERPHPLLQSHTNWSDFQSRSPVGILLLGLEQMLLDGVSVPLTRYLKMSVFSTETLLYSLTHRLASPRLEEP